MRRRSVAAVLAGGLAALLLLSGCATQRLSVGAVLKNAGALNGRTVTVQGRVRGSTFLFGSGAYQVDDGTGRIWVLSRRGKPGASTTVDGKVRQVMKVGPLQVVGLEEVARY